MSSATGADSSTGVRRAQLRLKRIDPWSVAKVAFIFSVG
ncbi:MAG: DUF3566 domain-containing protein, partial [Actinobacteria bacterium]|nr:DUF3566 domain-containing protein [Actinomycetota bacterium]